MVTSSHDWQDVKFSEDVCDATTVDIDNILSRIEKRKDKIFTNGETLNIRITDFWKQKDGTVTVDSKICKNIKELSSHFPRPDQVQARSRIISVYAPSTIEPLQITSLALQKLLQAYDVHSEFLKTLLSFGEEPNVADVASNNASIQTINGNRTCTSYLLNYIEENQRSRSKPWSFRRTAVYHDKSPDFDFFLILHPTEKDTFSRRFERLFLPPILPDLPNKHALKVVNDPSRIHLLLFSSYLENWRQYITFLADDWDYENDMALGIDPHTDSVDDSFSRVQKLRHIHDRVSLVLASCSGNLLLVNLLKEHPNGLTSRRDELASHATSVSGSIESVKAFTPRIQNTIDLVGYTLTLYNQLETAKIDQALQKTTEQMRNLTQNTVDDSSTVKIVTLLSTIYLPGSFVASMFGTNFFVYNTESNGIILGDNFWVFIAVWLPLTVITALAFVFIRYPAFVKRNVSNRLGNYSEKV